MKKFLFLGVLICLFFSTTIFADESTVFPGYKLQKGTSFQYLLVVETDFTQNNSEPLITRHEKWQIKIRFKVNNPQNEKQYSITATYQSIGYELKTPFDDYKYQNLKSGSKKLPDYLLPYAGLIGTEIKISLSNHGITEPIQTSNELNNSEKITSTSLLNFNDSMIGLPVFHSIINDIFLRYPDSLEPKQTKDSWEQNIIISNGRLFPNSKVLYTIETITKDKFVLTAQGDCQLNTQNSFAINNKDNKFEERLTTKLVGPFNGQFEVDKKSGLPLSGNIQLNLSGEVNRLDMVIPTTVRMNIHSRKI